MPFWLSCERACGQLKKQKKKITPNEKNGRAFSRERGSVCSMVNISIIRVYKIIHVTQPVFQKSVRI